MSCAPAPRPSGQALSVQDFDGNPELVFEEHLKAAQREISELYRQAVHSLRSLRAENDALRRAAECAHDGAVCAIEGRGGGAAGASRKPAPPHGIGCCLGWGLQGAAGARAAGGGPAQGAGRAPRGGLAKAGAVAFGAAAAAPRPQAAPLHRASANAEAAQAAQAQGPLGQSSAASPCRHVGASPEAPTPSAQPLGKSAASPSEPPSPSFLGRRTAEADAAESPSRNTSRNGKRHPTFSSSKHSGEANDVVTLVSSSSFKDEVADVYSPRSPGGISLAPSSIESVIRSKKLEQSLKEDDSQRSCFRAINPMSPGRLLWDLIGLLLICYDLVAFPLLAFGPSPWAMSDTMQWISACFWLCDMPSQFFLSFPTPSGYFETRPAKTCKKYFKSWFFFDLTILLIDWGFLIYGLQEEFVSTLRSGKVLRLLKILKGMRIIRISEYLRLYDFMQDLLNSRVLVLLFRACELLVILITINHFICCLWYLIGDASRGISWVSSYVTTTGEPFKDFPLAYRYAVSLHWSLCQFTPASMEIFPTNETERWFCLLTILLGMVTFSSFVSQITSSVSQIREYRQDQAQQEYNLREFITHNKLSNNLSHEMWTFLRNTSVRNRGLPEQQVRLLQELPHRLMEKIHVEMYTHVLTQHPLMEHLSMRCWWFVRICDTAVKQRFVRMNHDCFRRGHVASMYFVARGELTYTAEILSGSGIGTRGDPGLGTSSETVVRENDWISEPALWLENWKHCGLLLANVHSEMIRVDQQDFRKATEDLGAIGLYRDAFQRRFAEAATDLPPDDPDVIRDLVGDAFMSDPAEAELWHSIGSVGSKVSWAPFGRTSKLHFQHPLFKLSG